MDKKDFFIIVDVIVLTLLAFSIGYGLGLFVGTFFKWLFVF